ncbi:aconitate hydratase AcnA [Rhodococcus sp. Z13]|uniref:Aconitate hydratase AcnA n=1 Tax=Rhodococcus sacchari TaxID=2962047 RepID=A0ACD4DD78_9NOCA|nr:aconitate hydratase AcnA [Rhodococcus sp. Z13]UYP17926.1 aconitate hydratase AcnA [Rhodococcus sp. Z13]
MSTDRTDPFGSLRTLPVEDATGAPLYYHSLAEAEAGGAGPIADLPWSLRTLAEGVLRHQGHPQATPEHVRAITRRDTSAAIPFFPGRVLFQDASGIPVLADMITLLERARAEGLDTAALEPALPLDLVVDHALEVDEYGSSVAAEKNIDLEYARHRDRYRFLRWAQDRLPGLRVVPPGTGICHQLNLEVLAPVVTTVESGDRHVAALDMLVGTDSHTTMINALGVTGWGVGGIEATAAALGQAVMIRVPRVVGVELTGRLAPGVFASDLALTLAEKLRALNVVGAVVEFYGPGLSALSVPDRATVANMAPEYGATMAWFPADRRTIAYLAATGRSPERVHLAEQYLKAQGLFHTEDSPAPRFETTLSLDLGRIATTLAGPSRPHDALTLSEVPTSAGENASGTGDSASPKDGDIAIAAITSCTNTSNPRSLVAAGLLARNAVAAGLRPPAWTKTSFTPGSRAAADLLASAGLQEHLDRLGFQVAGFGCGTCMGNSGPLGPVPAASDRTEGTALAAVLSGNRNFTGRIHPAVAHAYLASPAMVVAYALAGNVRVDLTNDPVGHREDGTAVTLADLWPSDEEIDALLAEHESAALGRGAQRELTTARWQELEYPRGEHYQWDGESGSIRRPPFTDPELTSPTLTGDLTARPLLVLGDAVTTDHISPVARVLPDSAAGRWLRERGVDERSLGTFSSRRLNHDVMIRGGFANTRLVNLLVPEKQGGWTRTAPGTEPVPVHEAAEYHRSQGTPVVVVAGELYGAGSARDWAAKVTRLLGIRAVLARSFERIHRTNLVAMGVLPIQWEGPAPESFDGSEEIDLLGLSELGSTTEITVRVRRNGEILWKDTATCRIDTPLEWEWLRAGGLFGHLLTQQANRQRATTERNPLG